MPVSYWFFRRERHSRRRIGPWKDLVDLWYSGEEGQTFPHQLVEEGMYSISYEPILSASNLRTETLLCTLILDLTRSTSFATP